MTINFSTPHENIEMRPRISVVGVGGAGGNAVNNMIRSNLEGVEFIVTNTDNQALSNSLADRRLQLGATVTQGLGAGSRPDVGQAAAEEAMDQLLDELVIVIWFLLQLVWEVEREQEPPPLLLKQPENEAF